MVGGVLERGGCEEHDRRKFAIHWYIRFFFISNFPLQPLKKYIFASSLPLDSFWVGGDWGIEGIEVRVV